MTQLSTRNKSQQKLISFSNRLYLMALTRAEMKGLPFAEYIRFLVVSDTSQGDAPMVDEETNRRIGESLKAYAEGRYEVFDPSDPKQLAKAAGL